MTKEVAKYFEGIGRRKEATARARIYLNPTDTKGGLTINGKTLPQRHIYYLMLTKTTPVESIGFPESSTVSVMSFLFNSASA